MGAILKQIFAKEHKRSHLVIREILDTLRASYPANWWRVSCKWKNYDWALRVKKGVGESAEWNNVGYSYEFDFHVWTVPIAQLKERGGKCSAEKERKAREIIESVAVMFRQKGNGVSSESIADEVVSRLDKERLNWVHIGVLYMFSTVQFSRSDDISVVHTFVDILKSRYSMYIYLTS